MKTIGLLYLFLIFGHCLAQDPVALRHYTTPMHSSDFYILTEDAKIKYIDTLHYYWFKSQKIHITQGYASGDLLNGPYTKYFVSGQLAEQGNFEEGLQTGEWKQWYESGQLASIYNFENGILNGNYSLFSPDGLITETGNYKAGKFHGAKIENGETTIYKNGKRKENRKKVESEEGESAEKIEKEKRGDSENEKQNFWSRIFKNKKDENKEEKDKDKKEKSKKDKRED